MSVVARHTNNPITTPVGTERVLQPYPINALCCAPETVGAV